MRALGLRLAKIANERVSGLPTGQWACIIASQGDDVRVTSESPDQSISWFARLRARIARIANDRTSSGPIAARVFHRALAAVFLIAWLSLAVQVDVLIGSRGLLPLGQFLDIVHERHLGFAEFPTLLRWFPSDLAMHVGISVGIACSVLGFVGVVPRVCVAINTALYLSFVVACRVFMRFQWDSLLIEAGALAVFLPRERRAAWVHVLFRILIFKLYFESGLVKWNSALHDWRDGSAMTFYYETAPLPTRLAWSAHHLPVWWHHLESWATLALELGVALLVFGPRRARLAAAFAFTAFHLGDFATANYGFFCPLSLALNCFLISDRDFRRAHVRALGWLPPRVRTLRIPRLLQPRTIAVPRAFRIAVAVLYTTFYLYASVYDALIQFVGDTRWQERFDKLDPVHRRYREFRLVNSYHLFGSITQQRIEPEFQVFDGETWSVADLRYKPGPPGRAPPFVAPHQPRVDFQLWFYGVSLIPPSADVETAQFVRAVALRRIPAYAVTLLERMCRDREAVQSLFSEPLPEHPEAVRVAFWEYHFTSAADRAEGNGWWRRRWLGDTGSLACRGSR